MTKKERCPWCVHNEFRCGEEEEKTCDFKTLKFDRESILRRMESEHEKIEEMKKRVEKGDTSAVNDLVDKSAGFSIMMRRLEVDFGVKREDIMRRFGMKDLTFTEKVRLVTKLAQMKEQRRKK